MGKVNSSLSNENQLQCVTFLVGNEIYGVDVMQAKEILYLIEITEVPNTLPFMKGVIDLRGLIVPLVDTRIKFNLEPREYNEDTVIIILELKNRLIGIIVDSVSDVLNISTDEIQDPEHFSNEIENDYVCGIVKIEDKLIIILDVNKIFSKEELHKMTVDEKVETANI